MPKIESITCHKILNSRGDWTISTKVTLDDGSIGEQTIPEGASKGENEAHFIPAEKATDVVSSVINDALYGKDPFDQLAIDELLIQMDGTKNKKHLGGNSILSVSLATAKACAKYENIELYAYLARIYNNKILTHDNITFPTPLFNILNGGKHANNNLSVQEFMVIPAMKYAYPKALQIGVDIYHILEELLLTQHKDVDVGDEGGFAPNGLTIETALSFIKEAALKKYLPGKDVFFGMDIAAESFYDKSSKHYVLPEENLHLTGELLLSKYIDLLKKFELIYIEDPFYENDIDMWKSVMRSLDHKVFISADDLTVTNPYFLQKAISQRLANSVIVKPNQVGSLSETFAFIKKAQSENMQIIVSHRSGDTGEDTFIADLSVAVGAQFIKSGAPVRGERVVKYNRLLEIYNQFH